MQLLIIQTPKTATSNADGFIHTLMPILRHNTCTFDDIKVLHKDFQPKCKVTVFTNVNKRSLSKSMLHMLTANDYHPHKLLVILWHDNIPDAWIKYAPVIIRFTHHDGYLKTYEDDTYVTKFRVNFDKPYEKRNALKKLARKYATYYHTT